MKVAKNSNDPNGQLAASRLLYLLPRGRDAFEAEQKVKELKRRYKNLKPALQIPFEKEHHEEFHRHLKALYEKSTQH